MNRALAMAGGANPGVLRAAALREQESPTPVFTIIGGTGAGENLPARTSDCPAPPAFADASARAAWIAENPGCPEPLLAVPNSTVAPPGPAGDSHVVSVEPSADGLSWRVLIDTPRGRTVLTIASVVIAGLALWYMLSHRRGDDL